MINTAKQIIDEDENMTEVLPFEVKSSTKRPLVMSELTQEEFDSAIAKGIEDIKCGRIYSSEKVRERKRKIYGI